MNGTAPDGTDGTDANPFDKPIELPITGELDLHTFNPRDLKELLPAWLEACREKGFRQVRIVHGKGTGALRESVHALLRRSPLVESFALAGEGLGEWGATLANLKKR